MNYNVNKILEDNLFKKQFTYKKDCLKNCQLNHKEYRLTVKSNHAKIHRNLMAAGL